LFLFGVDIFICGLHLGLSLTDLDLQFLLSL
jgi:hypothetical protein